MAIKFVCRCGKRLRAQSTMAGRRSACPRCGAPVGVPALQPTVRGATLGPMSPSERLQSRLTSRPVLTVLASKAPLSKPAEVIAPASLHLADTTADSVLVQRPG